MLAATLGANLLTITLTDKTKIPGKAGKVKIRAGQDVYDVLSFT